MAQHSQLGRLLWWPRHAVNATDRSFHIAVAEPAYFGVEPEPWKTTAEPAPTKI